TVEEEQDLCITGEAQAAADAGMKFLSLPIPDRQVPPSENEFALIIGRLDAELSSGKNALVHCRQGIGRSGLVAISLLVLQGISIEAAIEKVSAARGLPVPETKEQRDWINHYAVKLARRKLQPTRDTIL